MIRFCDKEVCCAVETELDRGQLSEYFFQGHRGDPVCIFDENQKFIGMVTYASLLGKDLEDALIRDYLILNEHIWKNGRNCFKKLQTGFGEDLLLPVLNQDGDLICFAWQDKEADREIRMLEELNEHKSALQFRDIYHEYDSVTIYGCNELAWYFACYLKQSAFPVRLEGDLWRFFDVQNILGNGNSECEALDYRCLAVYGEGTEPLDSQIGLRCSVSAEFECIDRIYEENILEGIIKDGEGSAEDLLEKLIGKQIGLLGTGEASANAYDFLLSRGIDICCFISEGRDMDTLFGKRVLTRREAVYNYEDGIIFLDAAFSHSAWGEGETDLYHYLGYHRNEKFFLLQDYMEIPKKGLLHILNYILQNSEEKMVLFGEPGLCWKLNQIMKARYGIEPGQIVYCDILHKYEVNEIRMIQTAPEAISKNSECFLILPAYMECFIQTSKAMEYRKYLMAEYREAFFKYHITKVVDYTMEDPAAYMSMETEKTEERKESVLKAAKILIGSINMFSGHIFFRGILECHPDIILMDYGYLSNDLFFICTRLAMEKASDIMSVFWKLHDETLGISRGSRILNREAFCRSMEQMLEEKENFTSQELFVMFHIAYADMKGKKIKDRTKVIIFWEPHIFSDLVENYAEWLRDACDVGYIVTVVRNACIRAGSYLKAMLANGVPGIHILSGVLNLPNGEKKEYNGFNRIVMRFEDIKCNPKKELLYFCNKLGIPWSDTMLNAEASYGDVSGFDLRPVHRTYEEYFSSFDRFRISLITGPWQKKYGYPYVSSIDFSRRELKEMFSKKFRFEENWVFQNEEAEMKFLRWRRKMIGEFLLTVRRLEKKYL